MDENTTLILINIFIIGLIAIILVKLYYRRHEEKDKDIDLSSWIKSLNKNKDDYKPPSHDKNKLNYYNKNINQKFNTPTQNKINSPNNNELYNNLDKVNFHDEINPLTSKKTNIYEDNMNQNNKNTEKINFGNNINIDKTEKKDIAEKISQKNNTPLINEDQSTKKETYEQLNNDEKEIKIQNTTPDHELKDLFTIDELIKKSKRKDSKRNKNEEPNTTKTTTTTTPSAESKPNTEDITLKEQKTPESRLNAENLTLKETNSKNDMENNTDNYSKIDIIDKSDENQSEIPLKSPTKVEPINIIKENVEEKIEQLPQPVDQSTKKELYENEEPLNQPNIGFPDQPLDENLFEDNIIIENNTTSQEEDFSNEFNENINYDPELDYTKDLEKITNKFKNSKIFNTAKNKIFPNENEDEYMDEDFIRNVRSYGEPEYETNENNSYESNDIAVIEPIHNDKYDEVVDEKIREENTKKLNKIEIKEAPSKKSINFRLNNNNVTLNTDDEIIFNFNDESYSSRVYKITGEDITVKFRNRYITIKPSDIKKIF